MPQRRHPMPIKKPRKKKRRRRRRRKIMMKKTMECELCMAK
jgi:hypothetical protein